MQQHTSNDHHNTNGGAFPYRQVATLLFAKGRLLYRYPHHDAFMIDRTSVIQGSSGASGTSGVGNAPAGGREHTSATAGGSTTGAGAAGPGDIDQSDAAQPSSTTARDAPTGFGAVPNSSGSGMGSVETSFTSPFMTGGGGFPSRFDPQQVIHTPTTPSGLTHTFPGSTTSATGSSGDTPHPSPSQQQAPSTSATPSTTAPQQPASGLANAGPTASCLGVSVSTLQHLLSATFDSSLNVVNVGSVRLLVSPITLLDGTCASLVVALVRATEDVRIDQVQQFVQCFSRVLSREEQHNGFLTDECGRLLEVHNTSGSALSWSEVKQRSTEGELGGALKEELDGKQDSEQKSTTEASSNESDPPPPSVSGGPNEEKKKKSATTEANSSRRHQQQRVVSAAPLDPTAPSSSICDAIESFTAALQRTQHENVLVNRHVRIPEHWLDSSATFGAIGRVRHSKRILASLHREPPGHVPVALAKRDRCIDFDDELKSEYSTVMPVDTRKRFPLSLVKRMLSKVGCPPWRMAHLVKRLEEEATRHLTLQRLIAESRRNEESSQAAAEDQQRIATARLGESPPTTTATKLSPSPERNDAESVADATAKMLSVAANTPTPPDVHFSVLRIVEFLRQFNAIEVMEEGLLFTRGRLPPVGFRTPLELIFMKQSGAVMPCIVSKLPRRQDGKCCFGGSACRVCAGRTTAPGGKPAGCGTTSAANTGENAKDAWLNTKGDTAAAKHVTLAGNRLNNNVRGGSLGLGGRATNPAAASGPHAGAGRGIAIGNVVPPSVQLAPVSYMLQEWISHCAEQLRLRAQGLEAYITSTGTRTSYAAVDAKNSQPRASPEHTAEQHPTVGEWTGAFDNDATFTAQRAQNLQRQLGHRVASGASPHLCPLRTADLFFVSSILLVAVLRNDSLCTATTASVLHTEMKNFGSFLRNCGVVPYHHHQSNGNSHQNQQQLESKSSNEGSSVSSGEQKQARIEQHTEYLLKETPIGRYYSALGLGPLIRANAGAVIEVIEPEVLVHDLVSWMVPDVVSVVVRKCRPVE